MTPGSSGIKRGDLDRVLLPPAITFRKRSPHCCDFVIIFSLTSEFIPHTMLPTNSASDSLFIIVCVVWSRDVLHPPDEVFSLVVVPRFITSPGGAVNLLGDFAWIHIQPPVSACAEYCTRVIVYIAAGITVFLPVLPGDIGWVVCPAALRDVVRYPGATCVSIDLLRLYPHIQRCNPLHTIPTGRWDLNLRSMCLVSHKGSQFVC